MRIKIILFIIYTKHNNLFPRDFLTTIVIHCVCMCVKYDLATTKIWRKYYIKINSSTRMIMMCLFLPHDIQLVTLQFFLTKKYWILWFNKIRIVTKKFSLWNLDGNSTRRMATERIKKKIKKNKFCVFKYLKFWSGKCSKKHFFFFIYFDMIYGFSLYTRSSTITSNSSTAARFNWCVYLGLFIFPF